MTRKQKAGVAIAILLLLLSGAAMYAAFIQWGGGDAVALWTAVSGLFVIGFVNFSAHSQKKNRGTATVVSLIVLLLVGFASFHAFVVYVPDGTFGVYPQEGQQPRVLQENYTSLKSPFSQYYVFTYEPIEDAIWVPTIIQGQIVNVHLCYTYTLNPLMAQQLLGLAQTEQPIFMLMREFMAEVTARNCALLGQMAPNATRSDYEKAVAIGSLPILHSRGIRVESLGISRMIPVSVPAPQKETPPAEGHIQGSKDMT